MKKMFYRKPLLGITPRTYAICTPSGSGAVNNTTCDPTGSGAIPYSNTCYNGNVAGLYGCEPGTTAGNSNCDKGTHVYAKHRCLAGNGANY